MYIALYNVQVFSTELIIHDFTLRHGHMILFCYISDRIFVCYYVMHENNSISFQ